ncbi:MAG: methionine--tRNA ligase [Chloroflexota bacterium]|nr:methionine--tRNA ligase [Chloroflexota bacterium]
MSEHILVAIAWPYASANIHAGNVTGSHLPGDIYARYHRLAGNHVLMVSGSDSHGTPITVVAEQEVKSPREVFERFHHSFLELFQRLGISYDLFTHTDTENHHRVSQDFFLALLEKGYLYREVQEQMYSETQQRFLPDRYVEGTCPKCGYEDARGDQCENCNTLLDPKDLINPRSKFDGSTPRVRETEHFFLDLPELAQVGLAEWLQRGKEHWRPNVINFARRYVGDGLRGRPITRDLTWGIPVPVPEWEDKCLYVWFEAVIGYFSASREWAHNQGQPEAWKDWWYDPAAKTSYFIGKDNIPFHAVIWPAELMGVERLYEDDPAKKLNLPYDVPANEFMNLEGRKISGSRNWAVWVDEALDRYDPDALRYYLTMAMPESRDTDWLWDGFVHRNNDELVATWGNLVNRTLTFAYKRFDGQSPTPGPLEEIDTQLLAKIEAGFETVGQLIAGCKLRAALNEAMALAREANRYLDEKAPWFQIKEDREAAGATIYTTLKAIDSLKVLFAPFLPFTSERLHQYLGYEGALFGRSYITTFEEEGGRVHEALCYDPGAATGAWRPSQLPPGQTLRQPKPLFKKLDEDVIGEELARIGPERVQESSTR